MGSRKQAAMSVVLSAEISLRVGVPARVPEKSFSEGIVSKGVGRIGENHRVSEPGSPGLTVVEV